MTVILRSKDTKTDGALAHVPWVYRNYGAELVNLGALHWFAPNQANVDEGLADGQRVSVVRDRIFGGATWTQATAGQRPQWIKNYARGKPALLFSSSRNDVLAAPNLPAGNFSLWGLLVVPKLLASGQHYIWGTNNGGNRCTIRVNGTNNSNQHIVSRVGGATTNELTLANRPFDTRFMFELSIDMTTDEHGLVLNQGDFDAVDEDDNPTNKVTGIDIPALTSLVNTYGNFATAPNNTTAFSGYWIESILWPFSRNHANYNTARTVWRDYVNDKHKLGI